MEWSGRAPAPSASNAGKGLHQQEHAHAQDSKRTDRGNRHRLGKNSFHVAGQDRRGAIILRQKWSRIAWQ